MDRQGQLGVAIRCLFIQFASLEPLSRAPEPHAERVVLIIIPRSPEQPSDFVSPLMRRPDDAPGGCRPRPARLNALEQHALKLPAVFRPIRIDPTPPAIKRGTRLAQVRRPQRGLRTANRQSQRPQPRHIIPGPQLQVREDHPVAAQPTLQAKLTSHCRRRTVCLVQSTLKLKPHRP